MPAPPIPWDRIAPTLDAALGLDGAALDAVLADLAPDVRAEVERYLAYDTAPDPCLDVLAETGPSALEPLFHPAEAPAVWPEPGTVLGPYRLDARVGVGGHGAVYRATDPEAERTVAVKILATRRADVADRLRREVRTLARLDHPHVARLYASGTAADGRPFFAMEWIDGQTLDAYAAAEGLAAAARVALLEQVCAAVQHAHGRFVLHRDLKPANVLVAGPAEAPQVKVVDFGIGERFDGGDEGDASVAAPLPSPYLRLTPAYAAPEQLRGEAASVASDVYSLGVLVRAIVPDDLPMPRALREDLRAIVARATAADPAARYGTAAALGRDLHAARTDGEIEARLLSPPERIRRFARRHRRGLGVFAAVAAVFAAATALYVVSLTRALDRADREAAAAGETAELLSGVFGSADPFSARADTLRARQILDAAAAQFRARPPASAEVRTRMACTLGRVYTALSVADSARVFLDACIGALPADPATPWAIDALVARTALARLTGDSLAALDAGRRVAARARDGFGDESREYARALAALGHAHITASRYDSAAAVLGRAVPLLRRTYGPAHAETSAGLATYAHALQAVHRTDEAIAAAREAVEVEARLSGDRHPRTALRRLRLGTVYIDAERAADGAATLRRAVGDMARVLPPRHQSLIDARETLAGALSHLGRYGEALPLYADVYAQQSAALGADHPFNLMACANLGLTEVRAGERPRGLGRLAGCVARAERSPTPGDGFALYARMLYARGLLLDGQHARCARLFRALVPEFERVMVGQEWNDVARVGAGRCDLGARPADPEIARTAEADARTALARLATLLPPDAPDILAAEGLLARSLAAQRRTAEADTLAARLLRRATARYGPQSPATRAATADLAAVRAAHRLPAAIAP